MPYYKSMRQPAKLDAAALLEYALRTLGGKGHSIGELRTKLLRRAANTPDVTEVLSRLKQLGYLNDRKYADSYTHARLENQGFGKARVLRELAGKRVPKTVAEEAVTAAFADKDETGLIENFLRRKFRTVNLATHLADPKNLQSVYRKLRYAGFSSAPAIRVLKKYAAQAEELEALDDGQEPEGGPGEDT